jgi:hypothetical protein
VGEEVERVDAEADVVAADHLEVAVLPHVVVLDGGLVGWRVVRGHHGRGALKAEWMMSSESRGDRVEERDVLM